MAEHPAIEARGISKHFGEGEHLVKALDEVSVAIRRNEFFTLLGPSGCGKTTLLRLMAGFDQPTAGEIVLEGAVVSHLPPFKRPVNMVFQSYALFPHMTVAENVGFGLQMLGQPKDAVRDAVRRMLALVRLEGLEQRMPSQLSGGQQQRVALARALANHPKVLLLDEPLSALDLKLRKEMQLELKRLQRETAVTFVFVTHDQEEALTMSDRIAVMSEGQIQQVGAPQEVYENPVNRFVADFIGESNFLPARIEAATNGLLSCRLEGGALLEARGEGEPGRAVTLAVRPEKIRLFADNSPAAGARNRLAGRVVNAVYHGTSTTLHLELEGGLTLIARQTNEEDGAQPFAAGRAVGLELPAGALRVLRP